MRSPFEEMRMDDNLEKFFNLQIEEHIRVANRSNDILCKPFVNSVKICIECLKKSGKLLIFGNGGSAADAQHLSTELTVRFSKNRNAIAAISLATDTSALTAIGNDFGFEFIFSRQVQALGCSGDVAIGISTSVKSRNIINGFKEAKKMGLKCIAFTGRNIEALKKHSDEIISVPATNTSRIQEMHIMIGQMLCNAIEYKLGLTRLVKEED